MLKQQEMTILLIYYINTSKLLLQGSKTFGFTFCVFNPGFSCIIVFIHTFKNVKADFPLAHEIFTRRESKT